ncbi:hypothetical protein NC651_015513 [Populus alba x Populus x berolinensis]|nr:hypothetical protein NC651_015513 [Populus alba x Populus x berolinensis]
MEVVVVEEEEVVVVVMVEKKGGCDEMIIVIEKKEGEGDFVRKPLSRHPQESLAVGPAISLPPFSSLRLRNYYYTTPQVEKIHMNLVRYKRRHYCDFGFDPSVKTS